VTNVSTEFTETAWTFSTWKTEKVGQAMFNMDVRKEGP
jgi:hypothetical protein